MKDKVFVTGANGLLGTNLIIQLTEQGYSVCALVRDKKKFSFRNLDNLSLIEGDLTDSNKLVSQMKDCKYVVHIAANTSQKLLKFRNYYNTNVLGTQNIIDACIKNKIKKLIYIGTANTYGYGTELDPGEEESVMKHPFTKSFYALSKNQAQKLIDNVVNLNVTTISPTFMIGAYDSKPSSGKIILFALNKHFVFYPLGGKNFIHVADVSNAIIKALNIKESGGKYILANQNLSYKDFFKKVIYLNKQKTILIPIPNFILKSIGLIGDIFRFFGAKIEISSVNTKILTIKNYYSNKKVKKDFGIKFTSIDKAISDFLEYYNKK